MVLTLTVKVKPVKKTLSLESLSMQDQHLLIHGPHRELMATLQQLNTYISKELEAGPTQMSEGSMLDNLNIVYTLEM